MGKLAVWAVQQRILGTIMGFRIAEESHYRDTRPNEVQGTANARSGTHLTVKRIFDIVISTLVILLVTPLLLVCMLLIRLQDGEKSIFSQERIGQSGKTFRCFKLRSMVPDAEMQLEFLLERCPKARAQWDADQKLENDPRITPLGRFLRKSSIDELPQLFNVLRGEMSLVGPRPIIQSEVERYGLYFDDYCSLKPGITGLWQVEGRSDTTYAERVELDVSYAKNQSLIGDIGICLRTVPAVMLRRGAK
ncbi:MAG: sugar transferase [Pseudomonadota bacterium]